MAFDLSKANQILTTFDNLNSSISNIGNQIIQSQVQKYQKALQERVFDREDNAVLRRAQDLEKAGLSKTLAAGSAAGSGSLVSGLVVPQLQGTDYSSRMQNALALKQVDANIKNVQADTLNKMREGAFYDTRAALADAQIAQYQQNVATQQAQVALYGTQQEKMIGEMNLFSWQAQSMEANIRRTQVATEHELKKMGYTDAQIELARDQAQVFRNQAVKLGYEAAMAEQESHWKLSIPTASYVEMWRANLAQEMYKASMSEMEAYYMSMTASKMPTFSSGLGSVFNLGFSKTDNWPFTK